jgi:hypothetical protein
MVFVFQMEVYANDPSHGASEPDFSGEQSFLCNLLIRIKRRRKWCMFWGAKEGISGNAPFPPLEG